MNNVPLHDFFNTSVVNFQRYTFMMEVREYLENDLHRSIDDIERLDFDVEPIGRMHFEIAFHILFTDEHMATKIIAIQAVFE
jgi:hypothetical protein